MRPTIVLLVAGLWGAVFLASACSGAAPQRSESQAPAAAPAAPRASSEGAQSSADQAGDARMLVRTAALSLVVADVEDAMSQAAQLARGMGGYVVSSEVRDRAGDRVGRTALRVPAERLEDALAALKKMATRVTSASTQDKDVTEEFVDQEARLRTLRATEEQYLRLMLDARTTEDILKIQQALGQVREQIERTEGRIQYLRRSAEMALISVEFTPVGTARPLESEAWSAAETFYAALQALVAVALGLAGLAIWIVVFAPLWVPAWLLIRWWRRRRRPVAPLPPAAAGS